MQLTSPPRRALGLVAVGALGMSTAVLGAGAAQAAPVTPAPITFSADDGHMLTIDHGYCEIDWTIDGGGGGANAAGEPGSPGGRLVVTTPVQDGDEFYFYPGMPGDHGMPGGTGGHGGSAGYPDYDGGHGGPEAGGGGAASYVQRNTQVVLSAFGGAGADAGPADGGAGGGSGLNVWTEGPLFHEQETAVAPSAAHGSISGTVQPCVETPTSPVVDLPGTPEIKWVLDGDTKALLQIWRGYVPEDVSTVVYEYSLDGGEWKKLVTSADFQVEPTITGLVNGKTYSLRSRSRTPARWTARRWTPRRVAARSASRSVRSTPWPLLRPRTWATPSQPSLSRPRLVPVSQRPPCRRPRVC